MDKVFAHELRLAKVSYFLPMRRREDGKADLLLPGFVFFLGRPTVLYAAYDTHRVVQVLRTKDQKGLRLDLRKFSQFIEELQFEGFTQIKPGTLVRIKKPHSAAGLEAKVDLRQGNRISLDLTILGRSAVFKIDAKHLEVITPCQ
jgi:hypothetical protein